MVEDKKILNDEAVEAVSGGGANGPSWYENGCTSTVLSPVTRSPRSL